MLINCALGWGLGSEDLKDGGLDTWGLNSDFASLGLESAWERGFWELSKEASREPGVTPTEKEGLDSVLVTS